MARFSEIASLVTVATTRNSEGGSVKTRTEKDVFANVMKIGTSAWADARSAGLHADALIEVRTCDYQDQQEAVLNGTEYEIERASSSGDFIRLTLARKAINV